MGVGSHGQQSSTPQVAVCLEPGDRSALSEARVQAQLGMLGTAIAAVEQACPALAPLPAPDLPNVCPPLAANTLLLGCCYAGCCNSVPGAHAAVVWASQLAMR